MPVQSRIAGAVQYAGEKMPAFENVAPENFHAAVVPGAEHNERFWRDEFPEAVRFLFGPR